MNMNAYKMLMLSILMLFSALANAGNLSRADFSGTWISNWSAIKGEKDKLVISPDLSSTFERKAGGSNHIILKSKDAKIYEDLLIIKYYAKDNVLIYKLVLSGWKVAKKKALYGTLLLYDKDGEYNGLPVSFYNKLKK